MTSKTASYNGLELARTSDAVLITGTHPEHPNNEEHVSCSSLLGFRPARSSSRRAVLVNLLSLAFPAHVEAHCLAAS